MSENQTKFFVSCPIGCEPYLTDELNALGCDVVTPERNGVTFEGGPDQARQVCMWSRVASRVLQPIAEVQAGTADILYKECYKIAWEEYLSATSTFAIHGIGISQQIRHSGFLALKIKDAVADHMRRTIGRRPDVDKSDPDVRFVARLDGDRCLLLLDWSGISLHKRGYRLHATEAPMKENLAATLLMALGYDGGQPLYDPMCGSGTILIEAAEMAAGLAPGRRAAFGFERWPRWTRGEKNAFREWKADIAQRTSSKGAVIFGADCDSAAVRVAKEHVSWAGMEKSVRVEKRDISKFPDGFEGMILTNPPYGERLSPNDNETLLSLYSRMGDMWRDLPSAKIGVFCAHKEFKKSFHLKPQEQVRLFNGPLATVLYIYEVGRLYERKLKKES